MRGTATIALMPSTFDRSHPGPAVTPYRRAVGWLAPVALLAGALAAAAALLAGPGYRSGVLALGTGIQTIRWAALLAIAGAVLAGFALALAPSAGLRRKLPLALLALLVNLGVALPPLLLYRHAAALPAIHDISTDTVDPPQFVAIVPLRAAAANGTDYPPQTARLQQQAYPDIEPFRLATPPQQTFERAARAARAMNWEIVAIAPDDLRIEATATTLLFGFKDDIVIRVRPTEAGSRVDVRSLSRVGRSDLGVNAARIRSYLKQFAAS